MNKCSKPFKILKYYITSRMNVINVVLIFLLLWSSFMTIKCILKNEKAKVDKKCHI